MVTLAVVVECDCCAGRGVVQAQSLTDRTEPPQVVTCPLCLGLGAHIAPKGDTS